MIARAGSLFVAVALFALMPGCTCAKKKAAPSEKAAPIAEREGEAAPTERAASAPAPTPARPTDPASATPTAAAKPRIDPTPHPPITGPAAKIREPLPFGEGRVNTDDVKSAADPRYDSDLIARAEVEIGTPTSDDEFDLDRITMQLKRIRSFVRSCHQRALKEDPTIAGSLVVDVRFDGRGLAQKVDTVTNTVGAGVADCVSTRLRSIRIGAGDPVSIRIPITFVVEK